MQGQNVINRRQFLSSVSAAALLAALPLPLVMGRAAKVAVARMYFIDAIVSQANLS